MGYIVHKLKQVQGETGERVSMWVGEAETREGDPQVNTLNMSKEAHVTHD